MTANAEDDPDRATVDPDAPTPAESAARALQARDAIPPRQRLGAARVIGAVIAGLIVAAVLWFGGVEVGFAGAGGVLIALLFVAWGAYAGGRSTEWPPAPPPPRTGTRTDVSSLAWGFRMHRGVVRDQGLSAVRKLAVARLARIGLDLDDQQDHDAIAALIGAHALATLTRSSASARGGALSLAALERCLDALDSLVTPSPDDTPPHSQEGHRTW